MDLEAGERIGTYEVVSRLADGGTANVYVVKLSDGVRRVAKVFLEPTASDAEDELGRMRVEHFRLFQERLIATLNRTAFGCRTVELFEDSGWFVKIIEYLHGFPLTERLRSATVDQAWDVATVFCFALKSAHEEGIANLDLKPDNIQVQEMGPGWSMRLLDFDSGWIGFPLPEGGIYRRDRYPSTAGYQTPEYLDWEESGSRVRAFPELPADVFQAGLVLFEIFAKRSMWEALGRDEAGAVVRRPGGEALVARALRAPGVPATVADLIRPMLARDPGRRPVIADVHQRLRTLRPAAMPLPPPSRLTVATHLARAELEARVGAVVVLDSRFDPKWQSPIGRVLFHGDRYVLQMFVRGATLDGVPLQPGTATVPVAPGRSLTCQGVQARFL